MSTFYVTTPIYYVNDLPHIGHVYTTVVADTVARYRRLKGDDVYFVTGTDEHGVNILRIAEEKGITPQEQADRVVERYHELWRQVGISHDDFIRTTEQRHHRAVRAIIRRIEANGDLYVDKHEGWYCASCETFYTEKEIGESKTCPVHESPTEWQSEENVFFRLSKYQDRLLEWYAQPGSVEPASRRNEVRSFVESGLRDLSVSRANLPWGVSFPGHEGQTVYVWLEALTNYLSALGFGEAGEDKGPYDRYWAAENGPRIQLVGKDILRFHAVYWPAFLMSAGLPLPTTVWAHGWWLRDAKKVSKSVGNIVQLDHLFAHFGVDPVRYFLLREMVFGQDASFSDEAFVDRFNSDLANDLGNTLSRLVKLSSKAFDGKTPPESCGNNPVKVTAEVAIPEYLEAMDAFAFQNALRSLWRILAEVNQYLVSREPWKALKAGEVDERVSRILWNGLEGVRLVATGLLPVMPTLAARVLSALGVDPDTADADSLTWGRLPLSAQLPAKQTLFPRIDKAAFLAGKLGPAALPDAATEKEESNMITIDEFSKTELKVAHVVGAERVPKSKKLIKLEVEVGVERRTLVAGIAEAYEAEELVGKQVVIVANLQPAKLMGVESQGMVLAASVDGKPVLLHPGSDVPSGTPVK
ncbi:MAG: methionine--tRNA ligase [Thermoanaerobaculia bacterium]